MVVVDLQHIEGDDPTSDTDESEPEAQDQQLSPIERRKRKKLDKKKPRKKLTPAVRDLRRLSRPQTGRVGWD
jgi:hypothetical protein